MEQMNFARHSVDTRGKWGILYHHHFFKYNFALTSNNLSTTYICIELMGEERDSGQSAEVNNLQ